MFRTTPRAALTGAALLGLGLAATGCSAQSGGATTAVTTASSASASNAPAISGTTAAAASTCTPQTTNVSAESVTEIISTLAAELPKSCGFTVSGYLDGAAELPDGLSIQDKATVDSAGNVHVAVADQGIVVDVYAVSGTEYVHLYEPGQAGTAPDSTVEGSWGSVLTSSQAASAGVNFVKLTSTQSAAYTSGGLAGNDALLTPGKLASDLTSGSSGWTLGGTATVDGVSCVQLTAPSAQDAPATTISVNAATGLPVQVAYTASQGSTPTTLTFTDYGTTAAVSAPSGAVDGSSL